LVSPFEGEIRNAKSGFRNLPLVLVILDGWGIAPSWGGNAITLAKTPNFDRLWRDYPSTILRASDGAVGLPEGTPGNSEAGHLNIGAGRIVHQDFPMINREIENGKFFENKTMKAVLEHAQKNNSFIHLIGLLSKTGTHGHINHLYALLNYFKKNNFAHVAIHFFSDGRDSDPMSGIEMVVEAEAEIKKIGIGRIASIMGRYYGMDRDNRWGRTARAYRALVLGEAEQCEQPVDVFSQSYRMGVTDEFIEPRVIVDRENRMMNVADNDSVIFFNFRSDRIRQLVKAFVRPAPETFPDKKNLNNIFVATFATYEETGSENIARVFEPDKVREPIAKALSDNGLRQFHTAETEKYPHVTYFINGGKSDPHPGEIWEIVHSPKVKTYDLAPKMSAKAVAEKLLLKMNKKQFDVYIANFANPDMVGHTGSLEATMQAVSFVDFCLGRIIDMAQKREATVVITADHGNAEQMVNPGTGDADTEHTTNPVPFIIFNKNIDNRIKLQQSGKLADISPTIMQIIGVKKPPQMSGTSLFLNING
jgi:2,3-bisphosphoglycerate-independent phosphoglycerate mutase